MDDRGIRLRCVHATTAYIDRGAEARTPWVLKALCRSTDPEQFFVHGEAQWKAIAICRHCPVVAECRAYALDNRVEFGVWGGMTERQRRALLRQHPEVVSWSKFRVASKVPKAFKANTTRAAVRHRQAAAASEALKRLPASDPVTHMVLRLRVDNPELSLAELAGRCDPPMTRSAYAARLRRALGAA